MGTQPLNIMINKSPEHGPAPEHPPTKAAKSANRKATYACQSIFIIAAACAVASKATSVSSFTPSTPGLSTRIYQQTHSSSSSTSQSLSPPNLVKNPTFISRTPTRKTALFANTNTGTKKKSDSTEWNALLASFQMYKAAYGDLKVPSRFVVPSMPPWPESGWGLKLGQRVASIRSTGKYVDDDDERRKVLDDMGFLWRLRAPSPDKKVDVTFEQIYDALVTYRKEIQTDESLTVPTNFIVPNYDPWPEASRGMPLGKKIPTVRSKAYLKANPGAKEKLSEIGFEFDGKVAANDARFNNVYDALVRYKEINGDLLVPQPFIVAEGSSDWEERFWGLRLGARVNAIRSQGTFVKTNPSRKELLNKLGFEWELPSAGKKRGRKKKTEVEALSGPAPPGLLDGATETPVEEKNEDPEVAPAVPVYRENVFKVGNEPDAPTWGFEDEEVEKQATLEQQAAEEEFRPAKNLNTTLTEAAAMAKSVGVIEDLGQGKRVTKGSIHKEIPWFNDDFGEDFVFEDVVEALTFYKESYGSFDKLDVDFVVPEPTLGSDFDIEASADAAAAIAKAESMGEDSDALIAAEIERMELELSGGVPEAEEDEDSVKWPEHLSSMKLGHITSRIRDGSLEVRHLEERKSQLDKIGFDWGSDRKFLDVPFEKSMCAMFAYFLVRGDLFVYEDFVMPGDKPWPKALAGFELGKAVKRIRELQNFFEAYHPEKVKLLRRVEFVWFPELSLPLNPEEGPESWEDTFVEGVGHPFYQLNEPSVGTIERLQAMGPAEDEGKVNKSRYDYTEVAEFWERGDITDTGKESERPDWRPAEWLWFNGFGQLADEHEERYGIGAGLEMMRLIEDFNAGKIDEADFDKRGGAAILLWEEEQLKSEAISAGIEVLPDDTMTSIIDRIKNDPQFDELDDDSEYKKMIEDELDADDARDALIKKMDEELEVEQQSSMAVAAVEEETLDEDDDEEYEWEYDDEEDEIAPKKKKPASDDDDDDDVEFVDDDEEEEDEVEEDDDDDDFGIDEEDI